MYYVPNVKYMWVHTIPPFTFVKDSIYLLWELRKKISLHCIIYS